MIKKFLFFILVFISFPCYSWDINPEFHIGNDSRYIKSIKIQSETVLNGKRILFIGSSVTRGAASMSISFADMLQKKYNINMIKDAIDGSTLVDVNNKSYISRLKKYTTNDNIDIFNNEEFNSMSQYEYQLSMFDHVHPTLAGYSHWLPYFENALKEIFIKK